jgi:hypothetical protein
MKIKTTRTNMLRKNSNLGDKTPNLSSRTHSRLREWVRDLLFSCGED